MRAKLQSITVNTLLVQIISPSHQGCTADYYLWFYFFSSSLVRTEARASALLRCSAAKYPPFVDVAGLGNGELRCMSRWKILLLLYANVDSVSEALGG